MVYGSQPVRGRSQPSAAPGSGVLQGIGASAGQVQGVVQVVRNLQQWPEVDDQTILVVPYTDAGWAPLLAQVAGVIAETGGRLSHGAIVAREYGIPAVMGVPEATQVFHTGQQVWLDGAAGTVRILAPPNQP
ncbi:PEP-utilizing enzyme [Prochlorothrix hollandica]|uniref:PEP-utilizing enzyme n=1 Tax=Prochlorothrix hollandica TaxID=1223 RepID=UPI003DA72587